MKTRIGVHHRYSIATIAALFGLSCAIWVATAGNADDLAVLAANHPIEAESMVQVGALDASALLTMQIRFRLRNRAALDRLLKEQTDPASANYHKWLTTDEFRRRFGRTEAEQRAIAKWLAGAGFTVTRRTSEAVEFTGSVGSAEAAFAVHIARFGVGSLYANTTDPLIPRRFANLVGAVLGMDNMVRAMPLSHRAPMPEDLPMELAQVETDPVAAAPQAIVNGIQAFGPSDLRTFYDETVGSGQNGSSSCIAIVGVSDFLDATMPAFTNQFGLPTISYTRKVQGSNPGLNSAQQETELDFQWAHVAAPNASINYYFGNDLIGDIAGAVADNACGVISISYALCGASASYVTGVVDPILAQAVAQGQSVFVSAGDQGAAGLGLNSSGECVVNSTRSVNEMSADPNVTSVGGTQFSPIFSGGADQGYTTESAWDDYTGATGGGASQIFSKPGYQTGPGIPNDGARDVPDVALIASPVSGGVLRRQ